MEESRKDVVQFINLQLSSLGLPTYHDETQNSEKFCDPKFEELTSGLIKTLREQSRLLASHHSPVDSRIQNFINNYFKDIAIDKTYVLPNNTLILSKKGHAREVSLPPNGTLSKVIM
ncbi:hypothetical protein JCM19274_4165 [Algibacter lectus]|uniref:Uncharacterized protein n=1 Tax=Algibacter lectus TaxID=221126 RepID=A0A090WPQ9_9FLAO|nr:hypothetical protein [Algibacter lectus]GAL79080.1 hypothetical protein JCM19274_4165 [Algibacter lectus]